MTYWGAEAIEGKVVFLCQGQQSLPHPCQVQISRTTDLAMQKAGKGSSPLLRLSSDAMKLTLSLVSWFDINALYLSGDRAVWAQVAANTERIWLTIRKNPVPPAAATWLAEFRNLKHLGVGLSLSAAQSFVTPAFFKSLSTKLETISITLGQPSANLFSAIPRSVKTLEFPYNRNLPSLHLSKLPQSLTSLSVMNIRDSSIDPILPQLPATLLSLTIGDHAMHDDMLDHLPESLTELKLPRNMAITDKGIAKLPRTLTLLHLPSNLKLTDASAPDFPRSLTELDIHESKLTNRSLPSMPSELIHVVYPRSLISELTDDDLRFLHPNLSHINLREANKLTAHAMQLLPRKLIRWRQQTNLPSLLLDELALEYVKSLSQDSKSLSSSSSISPSSFTSNSAEVVLEVILPSWVHSRINDRFPAHLPRQITVINWNDVLFTDAATLNMPSTLTRLSLGSTMSFTDIALRQLPRTLLTLLIPRCIAITDTGLGYLPPGLQRLDIAMNRNVSDAGVALLPASLLELCLKTATQVTDEGIGNLPRGLLSLDLSWAKLTNKAVPLLPPQIRILEIDSSVQITKEAFEYFPKTLYRLCLRDAGRKVDSKDPALQHLIHIQYRNF